MKVLSVQRSKPEDSLGLDFEGVFDPRAAWESELEPFFQAGACLGLPLCRHVCQGAQQ